MGAARRNMRRQARLAAAQLVKSGVPARALGAVSSIERLKVTLLKIVDKLDKKLDTGEGEITIREGLAAINSLTKLEQVQSQLATQEVSEQSEPAASAAGLESITVSPEAEAKSGSQPKIAAATQAIVSAAATPLRAAG